MNIKLIHIKKSLIVFGRAFIASLFLWAIGGICFLFVLGSAGLSLLVGDTITAIHLINEWSIPMVVGGALGSLFGISFYERLREKTKNE